MSNYTPSQVSRIPYDSSDRRLFRSTAEKRLIDVWLICLAENIQIHQPSLSVLPDETVRLSCEIQYGTKVDRKIPTIFWFEDIYKVIRRERRWLIPILWSRHYSWIWSPTKLKRPCSILSPSSTVETVPLPCEVSKLIKSIGSIVFECRNRAFIPVQWMSPVLTVSTMITDSWK